MSLCFEIKGDKITDTVYPTMESIFIFYPIMAAYPIIILQTNLKAP